MIEANGSGLSEKARKALAAMETTRRKAVALADHFLKIIRERTPEKSEDTRKSWTIHILKNDLDGVIWTINPDGKEEIVGYLEWGTPPHIILPKWEYRGGDGVSRGVLVFEDKNGKTRFLTHVHHPGTKPLGIVRITQDEISVAERKLADDLQRILRSLS